MSAFKNAVNNNNTPRSQNLSSTANGGLSFKSTLNPLVDLFFMIGSLRGKSFNSYKAQFDAAYNANRILTLQMLLWTRDIRGGAGERNTTRELLQYLEVKHPQDLNLIIPVLADFGRWDDLLIFKTKAAKDVAYDSIVTALRAGNGLCAKWMPRFYKLKKNASGVIDTKTVSNQNRIAGNQIATELCALLGVNARGYRKLLTSLSVTVEQQMCADKWDEIDYNKLPSVASSRYLPAFMKHDEERYRAYLDALAKGDSDVKVNAGALYPYDITRTLRNGSAAATLANAQWDALANFMGNSKVIPMVDTSGSMSCSAGETKMSCLDVAVSLGLYIADKQEGAFKNMWLNFSSQPQVFELKGNNIFEKYTDLMKYTASKYWGGSTDIISAFHRILDVAVNNQVPAEEMPEVLMILSDMEFDQNCGYSGFNKTAYEKAVDAFKNAGYEIPTVVFWNLNARPKNNPVTHKTANVALVSGFSPNILPAILSGDSVDPVSVMMAAIDSDRYRVLQ